MVAAGLLIWNVNKKGNASAINRDDLFFVQSLQKTMCLLINFVMVVQDIRVVVGQYRTDLDCNLYQHKG